MFQIKEAQDKGLADMETGSEVYMSELLVSTTHEILIPFRPALTSKTSTKQTNKTKRICTN